MWGLDWRHDMSRVELAIVVIVIVLLIAVALTQVEKVMARAEQAQVTTTLSNLQTNLNILAFTYIIRGEGSRLAELDGSNPMAGFDDEAGQAALGEVSETLGRRIEGSQPSLKRYLGEMDSAAGEAVAGGAWYFDTDTRQLVYRVDYDAYFLSELDGPPRIGFRVALLYDDEDGDGQFTWKQDRFKGLTLKTQGQYKWRF